jgi:hypothetical protein
LTLTITKTPEVPSNSLQDIKLIDVKITLQTNQRFWVIGGTLDCDVIMPKASVCLGPQFAIRHHEGKVKVKDMSALNYWHETMIKLIEGHP